jgi:uncharacterized protein (DUF3084 family)
MDFLSLGFLVLMALMGGFVALFADKLGRKLGKKRLSFRRMRPRRVAETAVFVAGLLIPLATIGLVMLVSADLREILVRGRLIKEDLRVARQELDSAKLELERVSVQLAQMQEEVVTAKEDLEAAQEGLRKAQGLVAAAEKSASLADARALQSEANFRTAERRGEEARRRAQEIEARLATLNKDLEQVNVRLASLRKEHSELNADHSSLQTSYSGLETFRQELEEQNRELLLQIDENERAIEESRSEIQGLERERNQLQSETRRYREEFLEAVERLAEAQGAVQLWATSAHEPRFKPLIFRMEEEILRKPVPAGLTQERARAALESLLADVRRVAAARGAMPRFEGKEAGLFVRELPDNSVITPEQQEAALIERLTGLPHEAFITASAMFNAFAEEFVPIQVRIYENKLVYRQGQELAETRIEGGRSSEQILADIDQFVQNQIKPKAQSDQIIPVAGSAESFGRVSPDQIMEIVNQIRRTNRPVRLVAFAKSDTRAAGPLELEFRIR